MARDMLEATENSRAIPADRRLCSRLRAAPDSRVAFEVASIKPSPDDGIEGCNGGPGTHDPVRFACENYPLLNLLHMAFDVPEYAISGPSWTYTQLFNLEARVPEGATPQQFKMMLRNLLLDRFKLVSHSEKRQIPGYELLVSTNGAKLARSTGPPAQEIAARGVRTRLRLDETGYPELPPGRSEQMMGVRSLIRWRLIDRSMDELADRLTRRLGSPVINDTGLTGKYDFVLSWSMQYERADSKDDPGPSLSEALRRQLGLRLERKKVSTDVLVIDHVEKTPTEN